MTRVSPRQGGSSAGIASAVKVARQSLTAWTDAVPLLAMVVLAVTWGRELGGGAATFVGAVLAISVPAAVHHAEVVAHRIGEPYGALVLAVAVTVIEVGLIVTLMLSGKTDTSTLARDTVFAAVMLAMNGVVGLCLLVVTLRGHEADFKVEGIASALGTLATLATVSLVLPRFTTSEPGPEFSPEQLAFAGVASLVLYVLFVFIQTVRHQDYFVADETRDPVHAVNPTSRQALRSLGLLVIALACVVGLAKVESPAIEDAVDALGAPQSAVGVVIAVLVVAPESMAAIRSAARGHLQTSFNLAHGAAMASIGLTVPTIAVASIWLDGPLNLGLGAVHMVLLAITVIVSALTVLPGKATVQEAAVHLVLCCAFLFLAFRP